MVARSNSHCSLKNPASLHCPSKSLAYISGIFCVLFDLQGKRIAMPPRYLLIKQCILWEYRELSGTVKLPSQIATWLSPKGSEKKQSLYSKQPSACEKNKHRHCKGMRVSLLHNKAAPTRNKLHPSYSQCLQCYVEAALWNTLLMWQADIQTSSEKATFPTDS